MDAKACAEMLAKLSEALKAQEQAAHHLQIAALTPDASNADVAEILSYAARAAQLAEDMLNAIAHKTSAGK